MVSVPSWLGKVVIVIIPLLLLLGFLYVRGAFPKIKTAFTDTEQFINESFGLEEQVATTPAVSAEHRTMVLNMKAAIEDYMVGTLTNDCFKLFYHQAPLPKLGHTVDDQPVGEMAITMEYVEPSGSTPEYTSVTVRGGPGARQILTDLSFRVDGMRPCVISGDQQWFDWSGACSGNPPSVPDIFFEKFISAGTGPELIALILHNSGCAGSEFTYTVYLLNNGLVLVEFEDNTFRIDETGELTRDDSDYWECDNQEIFAREILGDQTFEELFHTLGSLTARMEPDTVTITRVRDGEILNDWTGFNHLATPVRELFEPFTNNIPDWSGDCPYYQPVDKIELYFGDVSGGTSASTNRIQYNNRNDELVIFSQYPLLFTPDGRNICFFPTIAHYSGLLSGLDYQECNNNGHSENIGGNNLLNEKCMDHLSMRVNNGQLTQCVPPEST